MVATPAQFEIWWIEEPKLARRPGLVITRNEAIPVLNALLVAPITRTVRRIKSELALGPDDGMPEECAATFDNIRPIRKSVFVQRICTLDAIRRQEVCRAIKATINC